MGGSKEGGIDFYGLLQMERFSSGVLLRNAQIRIIGQAKHYKDIVEHTEVRIFKTHRDDLLQDTGNAIKKLPYWFIESKDPLLSIFVVTNKFTKGAKAYAKKNNIILRDGEQVVEDLIKSANAKTWFTLKNGMMVFDEKFFTEFFAKRRTPEETQSSPDC